MVEANEYLSVTDLSQYLKRKFDLDPYLAKVYLTGEVSNFRLRPGHQYFSLKDEHAKIKAVMFKSAFEKLKFRPEEGMKVLVVGRVTMYEASGDYQIVIEHMEPDGVGALYQAYEQLKTKLQQQGWFDRPKRPLPRFAKRVAVVTSPSGAVIQDIMTTVARRYPLTQIVLYPAVVQGDQAADSLVTQLERIRARADFDAVIIGRGGGSIEDLWPFNEERVAKAMLDLPMPIVSSVGHETDTTIADYVADARAATPTAAAELVTPVTLVDTLNFIQQSQTRMNTAMLNRIRAQQDRLNRMTNSVVLTQPQRLYEQYAQNVDQLRVRLGNAMLQQLAAQQHRLGLAQQGLSPNQLRQQVELLKQQVQTAQARLNRSMQTQLATAKQRVQTTIEALDYLSPLKILSRGYTYVTDESDQMLKHVRELTPQQTAVIHLMDGTATVTVKETKPDE